MIDNQQLRTTIKAKQLQKAIKRETKLLEGIKGVRRHTTPNRPNKAKGRYQGKQRAAFTHTHTHTRTHK